MGRESLRQGCGLVLGKFLPPTTGHQYLVDFARNYCDDLTVVVGSLADEPIPGAVRLGWMQEMFPQIRVVHCTDENPQYPHEHPEFWSIWEKSLRAFVPNGVDYVFASEDYGEPLARILGASWVPVDTSRELIPISATQVRDDPLRHWAYIPDCVRPWYVQRILILGAESTGKTTLAATLARTFDTVWVHEYARPLIDALGGEVTRATFERIVRGQAAAEAALARQANRLLICDTDAFTTALYHEIFLGERPEWILNEARSRSYDLVLLCAPDTPYADDPQRNHPQKRQWFHDECRAWLMERSAPVIELTGSWAERTATAEAALRTLLEAPL